MQSTRGSAKLTLGLEHPGFQSTDIYSVNLENFLGFDGRFIQQMTQYLLEVN